MDWLKRMNRAIDYIEENLSKTIDKEKLAYIAGCSEFHFQKIFSYVANISLGEYIRRRRLTKAAFDVQATPIKILDLAYKYGYESPESFTRAFHRLHGTTPTSARNEGVKLKAYPRITINISVKGDVAMDYRIQTKEGFSIYGIEKIFSCLEEDNDQSVSEFWQSTIDNGELDKLVKSTNSRREKALLPVNGISQYRETQNKTFPYMLFGYVNNDAITGIYETADVPTSTWAIFRSREYSPDETTIVINNLNKRIYTEWLPTANYEHVEGYEHELYYLNQETNIGYCEILIRVQAI